VEGNDQEFLRAIHEEKIRTQNERTKLITMKLAFITVLFGINYVDMGIDILDLFWLLYFVPLVAISYDLYIMSADSRIKRIGIFLGRSPASIAGKAEMEWERFCSTFKDGMAPSANMLFSAIVTLGAAAFIHSQTGICGRLTQLLFSIWLISSLSAIIFLWIRHKSLIDKISDYKAF
jgi:hypothetical protein